MGLGLERCQPGSLRFAQLRIVLQGALVDGQQIRGWNRVRGQARSQVQCTDNQKSLHEIPIWRPSPGSLVLYSTISPAPGRSILRNPRVYNPGPGQNSAGQVKNFAEPLALEKLGHLCAAAAPATDHHCFLVRVKL